MTLNELQDHCAKKPGVGWDTPFGPDVLVFRVAGKAFALASIGVFDSVNLKCDPERAIEPLLGSTDGLPLFASLLATESFRAAAVH